MGVTGDVAEEQALFAARRAQRRGDWEDARRFFTAVLNQDPAHAEALHVLGVLDYQAGHLEPARDKLEKAACARPHAASILNNLGTVYLALQRFTESLRVYTRAVELEPDNMAYATNLAVALEKSGQYAPAASLARRILARAPDTHGLTHMVERAEAAPRPTSVPENTDPLPSPGHPATGRASSVAPVSSTTVRSTRASFAVSSAPSSPSLAPPSPASPSFAPASSATSPPATPFLSRGSVSPPPAATQTTPEDRFARGVTLEDRGQLEEALACYEVALQGMGRPPAPYLLARANVLKQLGRVEGAEEDFRRVLSFQPESVEAHIGLGSCLWLRGNVSQGAAHAEWRLKKDEEGAANAPRRIEGKPLWDGQPALDKTVLIHSEGEPGDVIRLVRLVRAVHAMVGRVVLEVPRPLVTLLRDSFRGLKVIARGEEPPPFDAHAPLMSLVHLLQLTLDDLPASPFPYLKAAPERVALWRDRLGRRTGRKVGLMWEGNPHAPHDRQTALPLASLVAALAVPGMRFIVLQKGESEVMRLLPLSLRGKLETLGVDFETGPDSYLDMLAVMENCDLVLSSDTAAAHLAGGLGKPCWTLLPFAPDSHWMLEREETPWYPHMRLFRQAVRGENAWDGVGLAVAAALRQESAYHS